MVAFNTIPGNLLVPFAYFEFNSGGSPYEGQSRLLLVGQKLAGGSATAGVPVGPVQSEREVAALAGVGSMLVEMYRYARLNAPYQPIWVLPIADPAGVAATWAYTVTAPGATGPGVMTVAGETVTIQVQSTDTATQIAAALVAAINAAGLVVTATNTAGVVTATARHVGALGNKILASVPALATGNVLVGKVTIAAGTTGTGVPSLTTPFANLGDDEFDWIASPYADAVSLDAARALLSDLSGRWSPSRQLYGHYITAEHGILSALVTLGNSRNDRHVSIIGSQPSPSAPWRWAAALGGVAAAHLTDAPELSRPLQTLELAGIQPPDDRSTWWAQPDRQALYVDGIAGARVTTDGRVLIDRIVTTEQVDTLGQPDATFRDIETMAQMMFVVRYFRIGIGQRHGRQALAADNPYGVAEITTPGDVTATLVHLYEELVALGVVERPDLFARFVQVERDPNNATRLNAYLPVDVVNQLRVFAGNVTAFLEYRFQSALP